MRPIVTLLTDFGTADGYVAEMKGVILSGAPGTDVVDLSHDIPPQDVHAARLAVARYWHRFPPGTIHLAVVDPGVGTERAALVVASDERFLVGPDNGVLSPALLRPGAVALTLNVPKVTSPTFHGRDVFAPTAAALARGEPFDLLGTLQTSPLVLRTPEPVREVDGGIRGEVIAIDRFGNAVTNIVVRQPGTVTVGTHEVPLKRTYGDVVTGLPVALVGSSGLLEVAVRDGSAALRLGLSRGSVVRFLPGG